MKHPKHKHYTVAQVREIDHFAIHTEGIAGYRLMSRAGEATFKAIQHYYPERHSMLVVCGLGNNGGDGYIIARLAHQAGFSVSVYTLGDIDKLKGDARLAKDDYLAVGGKIINELPDLSSVNLIVDAIFGTGLSRAAEGKWYDAIAAINQAQAKVIAVDIPSGLDGDSGLALGIAVKADLTVSYIAMKQGLVNDQANVYVGELLLDDLGIADIVAKYEATVLFPCECYQKLGEGECKKKTGKRRG